MKRVLTALVLIPLVLLLVLKAPDWLLALAVSIFALFATWEFLNITTSIEPVSKRLTLILVVLFSAGFVAFQDDVLRGIPYYLWPLFLSPLLTPAIAPFIFLIDALRAEDLSLTLRKAAVSYFVFPYVILPLASLLFMPTYGVRWFFILFLFVVVWSGDIFAYYVGKTIGRHKLAIRISPGKTWEGALASVVGATIVALLLVQYSGSVQNFLASVGAVPIPTLPGTDAGRVPRLNPAPIWLTLILAISINIAAQFGDLAESMIKRGARVKDSGTLFPGHGGVLDRIDALLFAAPLAVILFRFLHSYFHS